MGTAEIVVIVAAVVVGALVVVAFVAIRKHPEDASGHRGISRARLS